MQAAMRHKGVASTQISSARLPSRLQTLKPAPAIHVKYVFPLRSCIPAVHAAVGQNVHFKLQRKGDVVGPTQDTSFTLTVNISQRTQSGVVRLSQEDCMELLRSLGISATVCPTMSSVRDISSGQYHIENGVSLMLQNIQKTTVRETLWPLIRERYGLTCAHVSENNFKGCILDWIQPSLCPGKTGCQAQ